MKFTEKKLIKDLIYYLEIFHKGENKSNCDVCKIISKALKVIKK